MNDLEEVIVLETSTPDTNTYHDFIETYGTSTHINSCETSNVQYSIEEARVKAEELINDPDVDGYFELEVVAPNGERYGYPVDARKKR